MSLDNDKKLIRLPGKRFPDNYLDLKVLMDLIHAAERAELKLRTEYQSQVPAEDLSHPMESWAEGEDLRQALDAARFDILLNQFRGVTP